MLLDFALDFRTNLETGQYKNSLPTTKLLGDQMDMAEKGVRKKKVNVNVSVNVYVYVCVNVCVFVYMYMYMYMYL